jgi:hypothetical protein
MSFFAVSTVQIEQILAQVLWSRRYLADVFWQLMYRYVRQVARVYLQRICSICTVEAARKVFRKYLT